MPSLCETTQVGVQADTKYVAPTEHRNLFRSLTVLCLLFLSFALSRQHRTFDQDVVARHRGRLVHERQR